MGDSMVQLKQFDAAQAAYNRAMTLSRTGAGQPTAALAAVMEKLGDLYKLQGLLKVAAPLYKSALLLLETGGKKDSKTFENLQSKIAAVETSEAVRD